MRYEAWATLDGKPVNLGSFDAGNYWAAEDEGRRRTLLRKLDDGKPYKFAGVIKEAKSIAVR